MTTANALLAAALDYVRQKLPVFPLYSVVNGRCTCGSASCDGNSRGKHPRTPHGKDDATTNPVIIHRWWHVWPDANIGIRTGGRLLVVDVDPRTHGTETLALLEAQHGAFPPTYEVITGSPGRHLYFAVTDGTEIRGRRLGPGVELKAAGNYVVAPPSMHFSGRQYQWKVGDGKVAMAPAWLLSFTGSSNGAGRQEDPEPEPDWVTTLLRGVPEGERHESAKRLAGHFLGRKNSLERTLEILRGWAHKCTPSWTGPAADQELRDIVTWTADQEAQKTATDVPPIRPLELPRLDLPTLRTLVPFFDDLLTAFMPTTDAPLEFLVAAGLMATVGAMGKRYLLRVGTDVLYPNLWLALIADSSLPRKTTAQGIAHRIQHLTHGQWILPRAGSPEGFIQALADREGAGVQIIGEFGGWLRAMERNYLSGHKEVLTELYDSIPKFDQQRVRKKVSGATEKQPDSDIVTWPALSLFVASTRAWLNANLTDADVQSGFLARFLFVLVTTTTQRPKLLATRRQPADPDALTRLVDTLSGVAPTAAGSATDGPPGQRLTIGPEAQAVYEQWAQTYLRTVPEAGPFYERLETTVLKLALVCAVLRGERTVIGQAGMAAAVILGRYFVQTIGHALARDFAIGRFAGKKQRILGLLAAAPGQTLKRSELTWKTGWEPKDLTAVLEALVDEGSVLEQEGGKGAMPGRKGKKYTLRTGAEA